MKIILNNLGVIIDGDYGNEVVNQSNHNINTLEFAIDDPDYQANYANYLATASFSFQGGEKEVSDILMGSTRFEFKGKTYNGYSMKLTRNLTGYAGDMSITFRLKVLNHEPGARDPYKIIFASQPMQKMVTLTTGAVRYVPNISEEQYNQLLEQVGLKIPFTEKGQPEGVATLDQRGKIPLDQIPAPAYNLYPIFQSKIYDAERLSEIPYGLEGYYIVKRLIATVDPNRFYNIGLIKAKTDGVYTEDDIVVKNVYGKLLLLVNDEYVENEEGSYKWHLYTSTTQSFSEKPGEHLKFFDVFTDAGTKVGDNQGDAYDSCKGQHLERQIFADRFPYTAVTPLDEETGEITYMFNPNVVDRFDASELEETGYLKVWLKDGDNPNGGNQ